MMSSDFRTGYAGQGIDLDAIDAAPTYPTKGSEKYYASGGGGSSSFDCIDFGDCCSGKRAIVICVICVLLVFIFAIGLGVGLGKKDTGYQGTFANTYGDPCSSFKCQPTDYSRKPLLVIALDGLRYDYVNNTNYAPNIKRLAQCGVQAKLRPSFPALTYPNLYSIITGLYPDYHGVVSDYIYDEEDRQTFNPVETPESSRLSDGYWYNGKALWESATELGYITASHSWIASNVLDNRYEDGIRTVRNPTYYAEYDEDIAYIDRMNTIKAWIRAPTKTRPRFITMFMEDPGKTARKYGIYSKQFNDSLRKTDEAVGVVMEDLMEENMLDCVDVMIVSTSGMIDVTCDEVFYLDDFVDDVNDYEVSPDYIGSFAELMPNDRAKYNTSENLAEQLTCKEDFASFYMTNLTIPARYHYGSNERTTPLIVVMENGTAFAGGRKTNYDRENCRGANDGFDPYNMSMHGLFVGFGPSFKSGLNLKEPVANVELYNVMAELIGVTPEPNNGTKGRLRAAMQRPSSFETPEYRNNSENTTSVAYPPDSNERTRRHNAYESGCSCTADSLRLTQNNRDGNAYDDDLDLSESQKKSSRSTNARYGLPVLVNDTNPLGEDFGYLYQQRFISAYDNYIHIQRMVTFTIQKNMGRIGEITDCTRNDIRIQTENSIKCNTYIDEKFQGGLTRKFLFSCKKFTGSTTSGIADYTDQINCLVSSNIVPMYMEFYNDLWRYLVDETEDWANAHNGINVVVGPIFDTNHDSRRDTYYELAGSSNWITNTPVPTAYYYIATRCRGNRQITSCSDDPEDMEILSLVLPHSNEPFPNCKDFEERLADHRATVSDIEQLTGIVFFPKQTTDTSNAEDMMLKKLLFPNMWSTRN